MIKTMFIYSFLLSTLLLSQATASGIYKTDEELRKLLVKTAREFIGVKYVYGGNRIAKGLDCSSFVQKIYSFYGIDLPRSTRQQYSSGFSVSDMRELLPGDLLFFSNNGKTPSHVGIVSDRPGFFIHARRGKGKSRGVEESNFNQTYFKKHFLGAVRILDLD